MEMCWVPYAPTRIRIPMIDIPREADLVADGWTFEGIVIWPARGAYAMFSRKT